MITVEQVKQKLNILNDESDAYIQDEINRQEAFIKDYCNNDEIDFTLSSGLDHVLLHLVLREVNPETSLRAGKTSENVGVSYSFSDDLTQDMKKVLKKYKRISFV